MATVTHSIESNTGDASLVLWETLTSTNLDGSAYNNDGGADRCVHVIGTFDGATVTIQGANDDAQTWATLTDPTGTAATLTAAGLIQISEFTRYIRPLVSGAGGSTDIDVWLIARDTDN